MNIKKEIEERVSKIEYSESINKKDGCKEWFATFGAWTIYIKEIESSPFNSYEVQVNYYNCDFIGLEHTWYNLDTAKLGIKTFLVSFACGVCGLTLEECI